MMLAGDTALFTEVALRVFPVVGERIRKEPKHWWSVNDVAELYVQHLKAARLKRSDTAILAPLGLDHNSFIKRQQEMLPELATRIANQVQAFDPGSVQAIIAGVDPTGAHIYVATDAELDCHDHVGFASVGVGAWHANSQLMFGEHAKSDPLPATLLLVYSAKKRAEVAPGVGRNTDMFLISGLGGHVPVAPNVIQELEAIYQREKERIKEAEATGRVETQEYVERLVKEAGEKASENKQKDDSKAPDEIPKAGASADGVT